MDPYEVLGVEPADDATTIRNAYLALARRHHPDTHAAAGAAAIASAEQRMREINAAWAVLSDLDARRRYDRERTGPTPPAATIRRSAGGGWTPRSGDTAWMEDFEAWRNEADDIVPPEVPRTARQQAFTVLPVVLFGISLVMGFVGLAMNARPLLAASFVGVMASVMLLFVLTMLEMRGRGSRSR